MKLQVPPKSVLEVQCLSNKTHKSYNCLCLRIVVFNDVLWVKSGSVEVGVGKHCHPGRDLRCQGDSSNTLITLQPAMFCCNVNTDVQAEVVCITSSLTHPRGTVTIHSYAHCFFTNNPAAPVSSRFILLNRCTRYTHFGVSVECGKILHNKDHTTVFTGRDASKTSKLLSMCSEVPSNNLWFGGAT